MSQTPTPTPAVPVWEQAIIDKCDEAGLQIMAQVLFVLHERETVPSEALDALTAEDITEFYEGYLTRAIDDIERSLLGDFG